MSTSANPLRLVIFDWAGTTIDHGCFAPVAAFVETFARQGVDVTPAQARGPMGLHEKDHLRAMFGVPEVARCWRLAHGRDWEEQDLEKLYRDFMPLQLAVIDRHSRLVRGLDACIAALRRQGMKIGATTGYFRAAAERVYRAAREQGFVADCSVCAEDVPEGRPAPWMVYRVMETLGVYPPSTVVKVGDTVPDIGEGLHAGVWSIGVTSSSSAVGSTEEELTALPADQRCGLLAAARNSLLEAGAHAVIDTLAELPELLTDIAERLRRGGKP